MAVDRVARPLPVGVQIMSGLEDLQAGTIQGLVFTYELFDALPIHRLIGTTDGEVGELWVELGPDNELRYREGELSDPRLVSCMGPGGGKSLDPGQIVDVALEWGSLYTSLAALLERGLLVTCDYGFDRPKLFDRRVRFHGTLACYRRQQVHRNALSEVGKQDLTAHVDFTTLTEAGVAAGLETVAFTRQARWLMACGLFEELKQADQARRLQAMDLLSPNGMGEEIRVLVQARSVNPTGLFDLGVLGGSNLG